MLKACLFGSAVTLGLIAVPIVHFVTAIPAPFVGGYLAGSRAEVTGGGAAAVGVLMAVLLVAPVAGVFSVMSLLFGFGATAVVIGTVGFGVWIVLLGTLGAAVGGNAVRGQQTAGS
jgi:hypothetical protein